MLVRRKRHTNHQSRWSLHDLRRRVYIASLVAHVWALRPEAVRVGNKEATLHKIVVIFLYCKCNCFMNKTIGRPKKIEMASWIKQAVQEIQKATRTNTIKLHAENGKVSDVLLRRPSDEGHDDLQHSPRPHEPPTDFRGKVKLSLGNEVSCKTTNSENLATPKSVLLGHGTRRRSMTEAVVKFAKSAQTPCARRSSCPMLCDEELDKE